MSRIESIFRVLNEMPRDEFLQCVGKIEEHLTLVKSEYCSSQRQVVGEMRSRLQELLPKDGSAPEEWFENPKNAEFSEQTVALDSFLYPDFEEGLKEANVQTHQCADCGSKNIENIDVISHSFSEEELELIFLNLLADFDLSDKTLLDVGSRTGIVLYMVNAQLADRLILFRVICLPHWEL